MNGHAGYEIILAGNSDPSTLFVTQDIGWVLSTIRVNATYNTGAPVPSKTIMFKISDEFGEFNNGKRTIYKTTNTNGNAQATYRVHHKHRDEIGAEQTIYIYAVLQDDNRTDIPQAVVFDNIPIHLVTDFKAADTFDYIITSSDDVDGTIDNNVTLNASSGGTVTLYIYNSTGSATITYQVSVTDANGIIDSPTTGDTGSTPITATIDVNDTGAATDTATITYTVTDPATLIGQSFTFTITLQ
jgi:hypothetical protein